MSTKEDNIPYFTNIPNNSIEINGELKWLSRSLAVVVTIILNDTKALVVKRGKNVFEKGKWCNPCGYLDWNESGTQCSYREVWEESGLNIKDIIENNPDAITFQSMINPWDIVTNPNINNCQDIILYYGLFLNLEKEPILNIKNCDEEEIDDAKWIEIDKLKNYEFAFNHDKRILKYLKYKNENN